MPLTCYKCSFCGIIHNELRDCIVCEESHVTFEIIANLNDPKDPHHDFEVRCQGYSQGQAFPHTIEIKKHGELVASYNFDWEER